MKTISNLICPLVAAAVLLAVFSRLIAAVGADSLVTLAHGPLAVLAAGAAVIANPSRLRSAQGMALILFSSSVLASGAINRSSASGTAAFLLLFSEPFLLAYSVVSAGLPKERLRLLLGVLAVCSLAQIPACLVQFLVMDVSSHDLVTGTFVGQPSGSHVSGALAGTGLVVAASCLLLHSMSLRRRLGLITLGALLLCVLIITDARLAWAALIFPITYSSWQALFRGRAGSRPVIVLVSATACLVVFGIHRAGFPGDLVVQSLKAKVAGPAAVWEGDRYASSTLLIGTGPGESISRIALLGSPAYRKPHSPAARIGLQPGEMTDSILRMFPGVRSSVLSPFSSWGSLLGDLGILGAAMYSTMLLSLWRRRPAQPEAVTSNALLIYLTVLSCFQLWFEEPGLSLALVALVAVLSELSRDRETARHERP